MAEHTIHTRDLGPITFTNFGPTGYVRCDMGDKRKHGTLGKQICKGGRLVGVTLTADDAQLATIATRWWRAYQRRERAG